MFFLCAEDHYPIMTRFFLEIKNITLCAELVFCHFVHFLCKNLLLLCAEHHYPFQFKTHLLMIKFKVQVQRYLFSLRSIRKLL